MAPRPRAKGEAGLRQGPWAIRCYFGLRFSDNASSPSSGRLWRHGHYGRCRPLCFPSEGKKTHRVRPKFFANMGRHEQVTRPDQATPSGGLDCYFPVLEWFGTESHML